MTVPDEQLSVFLREIKDRPDDDVPRLILADWLQDHGEPRGEFVHLQVRRVRLRSQGTPNLSLLFLTGLLGEVTRLDLSGVPVVTLRALLHDAAGSLRTLLLRRTSLIDGEIERLAMARPLAGLRWLDLSDNG